MDVKDVRLKLVEFSMKHVSAAGPEGVITICKKLEEYILDLDKAEKAPDDGEKERRPRLALKAKDAPSNN